MEEREEKGEKEGEGMEVRKGMMDVCRETERGNRRED